MTVLSLGGADNENGSLSASVRGDVSHVAPANEVAVTKNVRNQAASQRITAEAAAHHGALSIDTAVGEDSNFSPAQLSAGEGAAPGGAPLRLFGNPVASPPMTPLESPEQRQALLRAELVQLESRQSRLQVAFERGMATGLVKLMELLLAACWRTLMRHYHASQVSWTGVRTVQRIGRDIKGSSFDMSFADCNNRG